MVNVTAALLGFACMMLVVWIARTISAVARARRNALELLGSRDLADLFIFLDTRALALGVSIGLLVLPVAVFLFAGSAVLAAILAVSILLLPTTLVRTLRARRLRRIERSLPDAFFALASLIKAGSALGAALTALPGYLQRPLADEMSLLVRQLRMGVPVQDAIAKWADRVVAVEARAFASLLTVVHGYGGSVAPALEQLAESGRRRLAMEDRIASLTSQGKLQGIVVTLLPIGLGFVLWQLDPESMRPLFASTRGLMVCGVVLLLLGTGWWGIRRIVNIRV